MIHKKYKFAKNISSMLAGIPFLLTSCNSLNGKYKMDSEQKEDSLTLVARPVGHDQLLGYLRQLTDGRVDETQDVREWLSLSQEAGQPRCSLCYLGVSKKYGFVSSTAECPLLSLMGEKDEAVFPGLLEGVKNWESMLAYQHHESSDPYTANSNRLSMLSYAAVIGSKNTMTFLLEQLANIDVEKGKEILGMSKNEDGIYVQKKSSPLLQVINNKSPNVSYEDQKNIIDQLIKSGAEINLADQEGRTPLMHAIRIAHPSMYFIDKHGNTMVKNLEIAKHIIEHLSPDLRCVDNQGYTAAMYAASGPYMDNLDILALILNQEEGNKNDKTNPNLEQQNKAGDTAFTLLKKTNVPYDDMQSPSSASALEQAQKEEELTTEKEKIQARIQYIKDKAK